MSSQSKDEFFRSLLCAALSGTASQPFTTKTMTEQGAKLAYELAESTYTLYMQKTNGDDEQSDSIVNGD